MNAESYPVPTQREYSADSVWRILVATTSGTDCDRFRALFLPSFHPETLITVSLFADGAGEIQMKAFERSLWLALADRVRWMPAALKERLLIKRGLKQVEHPPLPGVWEERAAIGRDLGESLRETIRNRFRCAHAEPKNSIGVDGIVLVGESSRSSAGEQLRFQAWSPRRGEAVSAYFAAIHQLASETLTTDRAQVCLEHIHGYLDLGLPIKDLRGNPRNIRIFGGLSSSQGADLKALLASVPPEVPVLIDMGNFESMGTALYPVFQEWLQRPGRVVFVASPEAMLHLGGIRVPPDRVFRNLAGARNRLLE